MESCILGALSQPYEFCQETQTRVHYGAAPKTSQNLRRHNEGTKAPPPPVEWSSSQSGSLTEPILTTIKPRRDLPQVLLKI